MFCLPGPPPCPSGPWPLSSSSPPPASWKNSNILVQLVLTFLCWIHSIILYWYWYVRRKSARSRKSKNSWRHFFKIWVRHCSPVCATVSRVLFVIPCAPLLSRVRHCYPVCGTVSHVLFVIPCAPLLSHVRHCNPVSTTAIPCSLLLSCVRSFCPVYPLISCVCHSCAVCSTAISCVRHCYPVCAPPMPCAQRLPTFYSPPLTGVPGSRTCSSGWMRASRALNKWWLKFKNAQWTINEERNWRSLLTSKNGKVGKII